MKSEHVERLTTLLHQTRPRLSTGYEVEFKNCFGAVAGYIDGRIFISCGKFGVALRLPQKRLNALMAEPDVAPLRYFPKGHIKKEYAVLPERILSDKVRLKKLIDSSIKYAVSSS